MPVLTARQIAHIKALRARAITGGRGQLMVLVSQSNNPIALAPTNPLALPGAPTIQDGGPGGTFPGGTVFGQVVALNANGQTIAGPQGGPANVPANHLCLVTPAPVPNATSYRVYVSLVSGAETFVGAVSPGQTLTISAPLSTGQEPAPYQSYVLVPGILRHQPGVNPRQPDESGFGGDHRLTQILLELPIATNTDGLVLIADCAVPSPSIVNLSTTARYMPTHLIPTGIAPGGDRKLGLLRRVR